MPMCLSLVRQIQQVTELDSIDQSSTEPLLNLIVRHSSDNKLESGNNKGLFVVSKINIEGREIRINLRFAFVYRRCQTKVIVIL